MAEPVVTKAWLGEADDGEEWAVEIEHDCMRDGSPVAVTIMTKYREDAEAAEVDTFVEITPEGAREMALALLFYADAADRENRRRAPALGEDLAPSLGQKDPS